MKSDEIAKVLREGGMRADLSGADLSGADDVIL